MTVFIVLVIFTLLLVLNEDETPPDFDREAWKRWQEKYSDWRKW